MLKQPAFENSSLESMKLESQGDSLDAKKGATYSDSLSTKIGIKAPVFILK